jgi:hypothetical protein
MRALAKMQLKQDKKTRRAMEDQFDLGEDEEEDDLEAAQEEAAILQRLEEEHQAELNQAAGIKQGRPGAGSSSGQQQRKQQPRRQGKRQGGQVPPKRNKPGSGDE